MDKTILLMNIILYVFIFLFAICIGSFLNVLIWRIPNKMSVNGRSICPKCNTPIKGYDLIPVLSFLFLGGKCRACKAKISFRYPAIELLTGILAVICFLRYNFTIEHLSWQPLVMFCLTAILICIAMIDIDTMEIPNGLVLAILVPAVASYFLFPEIGITARLIGLVCVSVPMFLLNLVIPDAFGGGDIKLIAACGLLLGWQNTLLSMFFALLFGGGYAVLMMLRKKVKGKQHISFGQYICAGVYIAMLFGEQIIDLYLDTFLRR